MTDRLRPLLSLLPGRYTIHRLDPNTELPQDLLPAAFLSVTRTSDELSIVCPEEFEVQSTRSSSGWRILRMEGPLEFELVGVLATITAVLAKAELSVFAISTFDTDYVLVKEDDLEKAMATLRAARYSVTTS